MCLAQSVGRGGINRREDVRTVQILLNAAAAPPDSPRALLAEDGRIGEKTVAAIEDYQRHAVGMNAPDGRIDPGGATLRRLRSDLPTGFTEAKLRAILIHASASDVARFFPSLRDRMATAGIDTPSRMAHFLAQVGHESGQLRYTEEIASGAAYEGRADLGNTQPGDGVRFKGRGLIQLTGRANYARYGQSRGTDFLSGDRPRLLATDPTLAVDVACWFWTDKKLNALADADDLRAVTRRINGGLNGLEDRAALLARAVFFLVPAAGTRRPTRPASAVRPTRAATATDSRAPRTPRATSRRRGPAGPVTKAKTKRRSGAGRRVNLRGRSKQVRA